MPAPTLPPPAPGPCPRVAQDRVLAPGERVEPSLPLGSDGVQRWVWHHRFGAMLIEVAGDQVFVNGQPVERHAP